MGAAQAPVGRRAAPAGSSASTGRAARAPHRFIGSSTTTSRPSRRSTTSGSRRRTAEVLATAERPNLLAVRAELLSHTTPRVHLTRRTLLEVVRRIARPDALTANPYEFARVATAIIKEKVIRQLVAASGTKRSWMTGGRCSGSRARLRGSCSAGTPGGRPGPACTTGWTVIPRWSSSVVRGDDTARSLSAGLGGGDGQPRGRRPPALPRGRDEKEGATPPASGRRRRRRSSARGPVSARGHGTPWGRWTG